jgi:hypothetical protein
VTASTDWVKLILDAPSATEAWLGIFAKLKDLAISSRSPVELHHQTVVPDRLLAEAAWDFWIRYVSEAPRTSTVLREWCSGPSSSGRAVLMLDALSLRELPLLLGGAEARDIIPTSVQVTGSEVPSDTDHFARALGVPSRSSLGNNGAPSSFALFNKMAYTDVLSLPFDDCIGAVPNDNNLLIWHTWLDDLIHVHNRLPDQIVKIAGTTLQSDGFWTFVDRLRQGRKLAITADHGYAASRLFSSEEIDREVIEALRDVFGASRYRAASTPWEHQFMPPVVMTQDGFHVVMGQRKWRVQGGFPQVCHGGLSLLEVAVPFVELPPLG